LSGEEESESVFPPQQTSPDDDKKAGKITIGCGILILTR
jgi:hypothetical protein